jgi:hypothetical protein
VVSFRSQPIGLLLNGSDRFMASNDAQTQFIQTEGGRIAFDDTGKSDTAAFLDEVSVPSLIVMARRIQTSRTLSKKLGAWLRGSMAEP